MTMKELRMIALLEIILKALYSFVKTDIRDILFLIITTSHTCTNEINTSKMNVEIVDKSTGTGLFWTISIGYY